MYDRPTCFEASVNHTDAIKNLRTSETLNHSASAHEITEAMDEWPLLRTANDMAFIRANVVRTVLGGVLLGADYSFILVFVEYQTFRREQMSCGNSSIAGDGRN